jgi:hypothetical protein
MKRDRAALLTLLVGLLAVPVGLTYREVQQERLNDSLIAAVGRNDTAGRRSGSPVLPDDPWMSAPGGAGASRRCSITRIHLADGV